MTTCNNSQFSTIQLTSLDIPKNKQKPILGENRTTQVLPFEDSRQAERRSVPSLDVYYSRGMACWHLFASMPCQPKMKLVAALYAPTSLM